LVPDLDDERGLIAQIQGSSFVDGPGIRTTIFLKGCPLRCLWCCNPEMQEDYPEKNILFPKKGTKEVFGKWSTIDEVMEIIQKDIPYYQVSQGGVTIGGGEPTYQPLYVSKLIKRCKELSIHTALDTCGYTVNKQATESLEEADLLLYDVKNIDPLEHKRNTGVSSDKILENLRRMVELKKKIIIRIPLIPGYTDNMENILRIGDFLASLGQNSISEVDLLPYNQGGIIKYDMLGRKYPLSMDLRHQSDEYLQELRQILMLRLDKACAVIVGS
jgi:pyruvate formate lyase activating enzyme